MTPSDNSTSSLKQRLLRLFQEKAYRRAYVESFLNTSIAAQIKANREKRGLSQAQLADLAGMKQSRISTMENVNYESWSIRTLKRLAEAFDLVLVVRFESFGGTVGDIVNLNRENLERPSFEKDPVFAISKADLMAPSTSGATVVNLKDRRLVTIGRQRAAIGATGQDKFVAADMSFQVKHG